MNAETNVTLNAEQQNVSDNLNRLVSQANDLQSRLTGPDSDAVMREAHIIETTANGMDVAFARVVAA